MTTRIPLCLAAALFVLTALAPHSRAQSAPLPPLTQNTRVMGELVAGEVGYQIQKHCGTISARMLRAMGRLSELESYATGLGYTQADFKALSKDPAARALRDARVDAYLASNGVTKGDADSYCRLGYQEIEKNTLTGWLLRGN